MNEIQFTNSDSFTADLISQLKNLSSSETPLIIRNGLQYKSKAQWFNFLKNQCHFLEDRRHFSDGNQLTHADWWEISYQPEKAKSYAYSNTRQPLHCDNAWFSDPAEINFFCMHKQARQGGQQTIYPVSRIINDLENEAPILFSDLTSIPVIIKKGQGQEQNQTTIIQLNKAQAKISWNFYRTEKASAKIQVMCEHFFRFLEKKEQTNSVERIHANSGDCFAFNDALLLHGREAFTATEPSERILYQSMWNNTGNLNDVK